MSDFQLDKIKFNDSLQKYIQACTETDWLTVGELYKFRFAIWLYDRIDFSTQTDDEILKICIESQNEKYDGRTKGLNFMVSSRRFGKEVIDLKDIRIIRDLFNGGEITKGKMTGTLALTKFSVWLATMLPKKFNTCPKIDLIHSLEYLFDKKGLPQKGYESFIQTQELLKILRSEIHENIGKFQPVSLKVTELQNITPVIEVWLVQDFIFFIRNKMPTEQKRKSQLTTNLSMVFIWMKMILLTEMNYCLPTKNLMLFMDLQVFPKIKPSLFKPEPEYFSMLIPVFM